jgi:hypothetical protein
VELTFILPPDFSGGGVGNVPGILMKSNEQARGTPLAGLTVKVIDDFYMVGLSNVDADRQRNVQLLKERSWFDVPLVYANQRRAILAIEKGLSGREAFGIAFSAWGQSTPLNQNNPPPMAGKGSTTVKLPAADEIHPTPIVFPSAVSPNYSSEEAGKARMLTCQDQYVSNKANNSNGGLLWVQEGGGYYAECNKRLKG